MNAARIRPAEERFWVKVRTGPGCWEWSAAVNQQGYGIFARGGKQGGCMLAHRFSYEALVGPVPDGICVLHRCDNPLCVRPNHLFLGTRTDNAADKVSKGRAAGPAGESHPKHKLTDEQVRELRSVWSAGGVTKAALARRYGVNHTSVRSIISGRNWRHLLES